MAPTGRSSDADLARRLLNESHRFSFFQAVELLQRFYGDDGAPVGQLGPPTKERLRFRPVLSFGFPCADISEIRLDEENAFERYEFEVSFMGLYGSTSPLPSFYTEDLLRETEEDSLVRGFLDIFHHRILSLLYRCWTKYRYYIQYRPAGEDRFSRRLFCLMGLGTATAKFDQDVSRVRLLRYIGLLNQRPVSALSVHCVVSDYFSVPTRIRQLLPQWVSIPARLHCRLGSENHQLGRSLHLGSRVRDRGGKFGITLGPTTFRPFRRFLPGEPDFRALGQLMQVFVQDGLGYEIELILREDGIPPLHLHPKSMSARLGQTSWLGKPKADAHVILQQPREAATA